MLFSLILILLFLRQSVNAHVGISVGEAASGSSPSVSVHTYRSENFYLHVPNEASSAMIRLDVSVPAILELIEEEQKEGWVAQQVKSGDFYIVSWYGRSLEPGSLGNIQSGETLTFGFATHVFGAGDYPLIVTEYFEDGSTQAWIVVVHAYDLSVLGVDARILGFILAAFALLLPVSQSLMMRLHKEPER